MNTVRIQIYAQHLNTIAAQSSCSVKSLEGLVANFFLLLTLGLFGSSLSGQQRSLEH